MLILGSMQVLFSEVNGLMKSKSTPVRRRVRDGIHRDMMAKFQGTYSL